MDRAYRFWLVLLFISTFFGYGCYVINRKSFSFSMSSMQGDLGLKKDSLGTILSSFFIVYAFSKFSVGFLSDVVGSPRILFASGLLISAIINILFGLSSSLWTFSLLWMINGLVQGGGWPPVSKLLRVWVPSESFGRWWSVISTSINLAAGSSSIAFAAICETFGWRYVFYIAGFTGAVMSVVIFLITRDSPEDVGLTRMSHGQPAPATKKDDPKMQKKSNWRLLSVLSDSFLWIVTGNYLLFYMVKTTASDWGQLYLIEHKNISSTYAAQAVGSLEVGGIVGSLIAGFSSDYFVTKYPQLKHFARLPVICCLVCVLAVTLYVLNHTDVITTKFQVNCCFFMLGLSLYGPIAIWGILAVENAPEGLEGTALSMASLSSQVGAFLAGYPFSRLVSKYGWGPSFVVLESICVCVVTSFSLVFLSKLRTREMKID
eukprot:m.29790 g.29790  ORF g.29790 m.29790 type:complete len:432 (+) comp31230_c0_seq2:84-1379(+)